MLILHRKICRQLTCSIFDIEVEVHPFEVSTSVPQAASQIYQCNNDAKVMLFDWQVSTIRESIQRVYVDLSLSTLFYRLTNLLKYFGYSDTIQHFASLTLVMLQAIVEEVVSCRNKILQLL